MTEKKITKRDKLNAIKAMVKGEGFTLDVSKEDIIEFCDKEIEALDKKAAKAKERAAEKKTEADALCDKITAVLGDEFETIADITAKIDDEDATNSKVGYRCNKLVELGIAVKGEVAVPATEGAKARKLVAFKKA